MSFTTRTCGEWHDRLKLSGADGIRLLLCPDQEYKELSRRIVGFGNYEPPEAPNCTVIVQGITALLGLEAK